MSNLTSALVDKIVQDCFSLYKKLPKTGKPIEGEWTVLSCVVRHDLNTEQIEIVSLGTGSKCIGATKMSSKGDIMNDSHAEVFARRGFLLYLYDNIERSLKNETSIFNQENSQFNLKDSIQFAFYSSQLPCGDASIISKSGEEEDFGDLLLSSKHKSGEEMCDIESKRVKVDSDIYRTGAKCLPHSNQDPKEQGTNYHLLGQVRTKPGRGDRTLSLSCSDKIAKWIHLGIHGGLLDLLCECIYIKHLIFGAGVPYSEESLCRALLKRHETSLNLDVVPKFYQSSLKFPNVKNETNKRPAPGSILWSKTTSQVLEVAVQGKKLGVTKKKAGLPSTSLSISKYNLYKRFLTIIQMNKDIKQNLVGEGNISCIPYNQMKKKSTRYMKTWLVVKQQFFKIWTVKPDMWDFCIDIGETIQCNALAIS